MLTGCPTDDDGDVVITKSGRYRSASFAPPDGTSAPPARGDCAYWRAIAESQPDFVIALDRDGTIQFINKMKPPLTVAATVGQPWTFLVRPDFKATLRGYLADVLTRGQPITFEAPSPTCPDTTYSCHMGPILRDGRITGAVLNARDISEEKRTNAKMMMADRLASVGSLAAGVAHEINNLLSSIKSNVEVALGELEALVVPARALEPLRDASLGAERVQQIVRDLKLFSRVDEEDRTPVDVAGVVASTVRLAAKQIEGRARIALDLQPVPPVLANQARLGQVVLNLVVNALQAVPEGAAADHVVSVATRRQGDQVVIAVADTGCGIPEAIRPYLFNPFFTTKPAGVGTGLGLSICQQIVSGLGGTIEYTTTLGQGTEFRIVLPASAAPAMDPPVIPDAPAVAPVPARGRILIVDDEPLVRRAMERILKAYDVTTAESALAAHQLLLAGHEFELVLCDLMMPEMDGPDLYAAVARDAPALRERMVFMSGGACTQRLREFLASVEDRYIEKPFTAVSLRQVVSTWFGLHAEP